MAKTAERKVEIAKRITRPRLRRARPRPRGADLRRAHLHADHRRRGVAALGGRDDRGDPPDQGRAARGEDLARRLQRLLRRLAAGARAVLNSVFLHHCVEAGLDLAMVNPNHITPYAEIPEDERELADDLVFNRREDALERFIAHFESKGEEDADEAGDPTEGMEPEEALHWHILRRKKDGRRGLDRPLGREDRRRPDPERGAAAGDEGGRRQVRRRRADPALRAAVGRGDEARRRPARELPRPDRGPHQGQGRDRDRLRRRPRHRQVAGQHDPHQQRLHGRRPRQAGPGRHDHRRRGRARGRRDRPLGAARLDLEADADLHPGAAPARARVPGADRRRRDQPRLRPPHRSTRTGKESDEVYEPGVFYCKDAFAGPRHDGRAGRRRGARPRWSSEIRAEAKAAAREAGRWSTTRRRRPTTRVRSAARTDAPIPEPPFWGAREVEVDLDEVFPYLDRHVLFKLHWGGRGSEGRGVAADRRGRRRARRASRRGSSGCGASRTTCTRGRGSATSPATPTATSWSSSTPRTPSASSSGSSSRASPSTTGSAWPTSSARSTRGERDVVALQGVTVGPEVTELIEQLERDGEFAEQLFVHGLGVQSAEGLAEWLHAEVRARARASTPTRAAATRGATRPAPTSPSTRRSGACSASRRSA